MRKPIFFMSVIATSMLLLEVCSAQPNSTETLMLKTQKSMPPVMLTPEEPTDVSSPEAKKSAKRSVHHRHRHRHAHYHHYRHHHGHHYTTYHHRYHHAHHLTSVALPVETHPATIILPPPVSLRAPQYSQEPVRYRHVNAMADNSKLALVPMTANPNESVGMAPIKKQTVLLTANTDTSGPRARFLHPFVTASVGFAYSGLGTGLYFRNGIIDYIYTPTGTNKHRLMLGGSIGDELRFPHGIALQLGVGLYQPSTTRVSGNLVQGLSPDYTHYRYHYNVASQQIMFEGKLLFTVQQYFLPYLYFGVGEAANKAYDFFTTVPPTVESTPNFPGKTTNNITWSAGLGLDVNLLSNLRAGIGYRYAYLGQVKTGRAEFVLPWSNTSYAARLKQSSWITNTFLFQLTYVY